MYPPLHVAVERCSLHRDVPHAYSRDTRDIKTVDLIHDRYTQGGVYVRVMSGKLQNRTIPTMTPTLMVVSLTLTDRDLISVNAKYSAQHFNSKQQN